MKLRGAAKRAFLAVMARGRAAARRRKNPLYARHDIDRGERIYPAMVDRRNEGAAPMLMNPSALIVNPRHRKRRRRRSNQVGFPNRTHRRRSWHRGHRRRRDNVLIPVVANRLRRRRHNQLMPLPNPGGGLVGKMIGMALPATAAGLGVGLIDAKLLAGRGAFMRYGAKVGLAALGLMTARRFPTLGPSLAAAGFSSIGYEFGMKMGGGVLAGSKKAGMKELAAMAAEEEEMSQLLATELHGYGMGLLVETESGMKALDPGDIGDDEGERMSGDDDDMGEDRAEMDAYEDEAA